MAVAVGSKFPSVECNKAMWPPTPFNLADYIAEKKVIIVGLPGAFTPTWSKDQVPGFKAARNEIRDKGVDEVLVYCVNDCAVMEGWAKDQKIAGSNITFFSDESAKLSTELGMMMDASVTGFTAPMDARCKRFALIVDKGTVTHVAVSESPDDPTGDAPGANANTSAAGMLAVL